MKKLLLLFIWASFVIPQTLQANVVTLQIGANTMNQQAGSSQDASHTQHCARR